MLTASLRQTARSNQLVLVDALVEYGKQLYELGRSKHSFSETVNAVIEKSPHLKPVMGAAWALISTWEKLHPTKVHPPMPWPMLQALVVTMLAWGWWRLALTSSLGFSAMLRPTELLQLSKNSFVTPIDRPWPRQGLAHFVAINQSRGPEVPNNSMCDSMSRW